MHRFATAAFGVSLASTVTATAAHGMTAGLARGAVLVALLLTGGFLLTHRLLGQRLVRPALVAAAALPLWLVLTRVGGHGAGDQDLSAFYVALLAGLAAWWFDATGETDER